MKMILGICCFAFSHDGKFLYAAVIADIPAENADITKLPAATGRRDGFLWDFESIEFFFGGKDNQSYQFILAPDNRLYDAFSRPNGPKNSAVKWNSQKIEFNTVKGSTSWDGFLAIPLDEIKFGKGKTEEVFKFNAYRNCRYNFPNEPMTWEQSCYLPTFGGFYNTERFGTLRLGK